MDQSFDPNTNRLMDIGYDLNGKLRLGISTEYLEDGINISLLEFTDTENDDDMEDPKGIGVNIPLSERNDLITFLKRTVQMLESIPDSGLDLDPDPALDLNPDPDLTPDPNPDPNPTPTNSR